MALESMECFCGVIISNCCSSSIINDNEILVVEVVVAENNGVVPDMHACHPKHLPKARLLISSHQTSAVVALNMDDMPNQGHGA